MWLYSPSWTEKRFSYDGVPFTRVESSSDGGGIFAVEVNDPKSGKYDALYQSHTNYDGIADVKLYVEKWHKPDIALMIMELKQSNSKDLAQIDLLAQKELELTQQVTATRISSTRQKLVSIQDRLQANVKSLESRIAKHKRSISDLFYAAGIYTIYVQVRERVQGRVR